jgi:hypothetical protein
MLIEPYAVPDKAEALFLEDPDGFIVLTREREVVRCINPARIAALCEVKDRPRSVDRFPRSPRRRNVARLPGPS